MWFEINDFRSEEDRKRVATIINISGLGLLPRKVESSDHYTKIHKMKFFFTLTKQSNYIFHAKQRKELESSIYSHTNEISTYEWKTQRKIKIYKRAVTVINKSIKIGTYNLPKHQLYLSTGWVWFWGTF